MEILSPAGSPQALYAAVASGADAVYFGGGGFNARHFAQNFEGEDMARAVSFCRQNGVRSYVTVNTLVSDLELPAVTAYLRELCALRERVFALEERLNAQEKVNEDENLQHSDKD